MSMFGVASQIHHLAHAHGLASAWRSHTTEHVDDSSIVRERLLHVMANLADLSVWNRESTKVLVASAVMHGLVTPAEVQAIQERHGIREAVTL